MIHFAGSEKSYYAQEVAESLKLPFEYNTEITYWTLELLESEALKVACEFLVIDVGGLTESATEISQTIKKISLSVSSKIIIVAEGFAEQSTLITEIKDLNLPLFFITSQNPSTVKEQYETIFTGQINKESHSKQHSETNLWQSLPEVQTVSANAQNNGYQTIAVAGCMNRIGATTQCIQIAKYLISNGKAACVIEMDKSGYLKLMSEYYAVQNLDSQLGKVTIENVDLFYNPESISQILKMDYEYIIYDFGAFNSENFPQIQFVEKQYKFIVAGTKPNELVKTLPVLQAFSNIEINYIFSFTPESDYKDILDLMDDKKRKTYFAGYIPDAFTLLSQSITTFQSIFNHAASTLPVEKKKNKFRFFK